MSKRGILIIVGLVAAAIGYWTFGRSDDESKGAAKQSRQDQSAQPHRVKTTPRSTVEPAAAHGTVTRKRDSAPVANATVHLVAASDDIRRARRADELAVETDKDGRWKLTDVPPGNYSISVAAAGFLPKTTAAVELRSGADVTLDTVIVNGGNALTGTISDMTGGTIGAALIRFTPIIGVLQPRQDRGFATMSKDGGTYELNVPDGRYRVMCSHEAYVSSARVVEIRGSKRTVDFALSPGGVIEGTVLSASSGKPVANASVRYSREAMREIPGLGTLAGMGQGGMVKADRNGRFRVRGLGAGAIKLRAHALGAASRDEVTVPLAIAERVTTVEVFVVDAYAITGKVVVKASSGSKARAAVGVWVTARARGGIAFTSFAKTTGDGSFAIDGVLPGRYALKVHGGAYLTPAIGTPITVANADKTGVELQVTQGATISGHVDPASAAEVGIKIAGAHGKGMSLGDGRMFEMLRMRSSVQTDDDGRFKIGPVRPGSLTLVAKAADGRKGELIVDVPEKGVANLVIQLEDKASVSGRVVDEDGKPVTDATVSLKQVNKGSRMTMIVNGRDMTADHSPTHEDGAFKIVGLAPGNYELSVKNRGGSPLKWARPKDKDKPSKPLAYKVEARKHHTGVTLRVEARNHVIKGVVLGPNGTPARDVWVNASPAATRRSLGGAPPPMPRPGGERTERVSIMVVVADDGGGGMGVGSAIGAVLTDKDGQFTIKNLRKGDYNLMAEGLRGTARGFVKAVKTGSTATVKLIALTRVKGVVTRDGKPVANFKVELSGAGRRSKWVRDPGGEFTLYRVDPGKYTVTISAATASGKVDITVEAGKTAEVKVDLQTLVKVTGKLVDPSGNPIANAKIVTGSTSGGNVQIQMVDGEVPDMSKADGTFELHLSPGGKVLLVMGDGNPRPRVMHRFEIKSKADVDLGEIKTSY